MYASNNRRKKAIIIDDVTRGGGTFIENVLTDGDFDVIAVTRDVATVSRLQDSVRPDVVAMHLLMPYIDGSRILEPMNDDDAVVVLVTAQSEASPELKARLTDLGADVIIDKATVEKDPSGFCAGLGTLASFQIASGRKSPGKSRQFIRGTDIFPLPPDEAIRLKTLDELGVANLDPSPGLDKIVTHLARKTGYPITAVNVIGAEEVWSKATYNAARCVVPREHAICSHTICHSLPFQVPDTHADYAMRDLPCVTGDPYVRSYVGAPIVAANTVAIGVICMADTKPRLASLAEIAHLKEAADIASEFMQQGSTPPAEPRP